ncbi:glycine betaine ABC transporter substrate-binding protein [Sporosarcina beigongshangi]|uniref:glycine betaine ABC transporter substrate-binding protein n=1 Tax=Sporosarcina beigongshangi TaxID=2782538 RepID=UPI001939A89F|nr:glycine betaine ABC transporter substrate-binding protein [Sporosarcina beigongshangi]
MTLLKKVTGIGTAALLALGLAACSSDSNEDKTTGTNAAVGESVDHTIVGIDPGSGHMELTAKVLQEYDLPDWNVTSGSGATMTAALKRAYDKEEPIIITAWSPHWKFSKFDLKYLDDPKLIYGDAEEIHSIGRIGLKEDLPEAYAIFERFEWDMDDMAQIMIAIEDGVKPEEAAQTWIDDNPEKVAEWTDGVATVDGDTIKLAYAPWDSELASHNMMKIVLEDMGYTVQLAMVEPGPMFSAVADGSADATFAAWLPNTHKTYVEKFDGQLDDIGVNMVGVKQGLAVPTYMEDVNSIEDLKK